MKSNVGGIDKAQRIIAGLAILSLLYLIPGHARWWGLLSLLPLATGPFYFSPAYALFGFNTSEKLVNCPGWWSFRAVRANRAGLHTLTVVRITSPAPGETGMIG